MKMKRLCYFTAPLSPWASFEFPLSTIVNEWICSLGGGALREFVIQLVSALIKITFGFSVKHLWTKAGDSRKLQHSNICGSSYTIFANCSRSHDFWKLTRSNNETLREQPLLFKILAVQTKHSLWLPKIWIRRGFCSAAEQLMHTAFTMRARKPSTNVSVWPRMASRTCNLHEYREYRAFAASLTLFYASYTVLSAPRSENLVM